MSAYYDQFLPAFETDARQYSIKLTVARVATQSEIDAAVANLAAAPAGGLIVLPDAYTLVHREVIVRSTAKHRIPAIYSYRQVIKEGGLMSYGPETADIFRRSASYVDRILKGANPADLPAQAPAKFEFAINLKTATTLGLTVPLDDFLPGYEASAWYGVGAPRDTPAEIVERLNKELNAAFADPRTKARIAELVGTPLPGSPANFNRFVAKEVEKWSRVVEFSGAKIKTE
jgi:hypothetical protein